jgi:hypothetical protein
MRAVLVLIVVVAVAGCGRKASDAPKGTAANPVDTCERFGDVCKLDSSRLGVCSPPKSGSGLVCTPQH